ncbi:MAG: 4-oxalomesaconate tautomerase [Campylobacteraceae bacterium]|nr:4-oxalomesaconate tautomerase [Campylobacteraceae bacterium]
MSFSQIPYMQIRGGTSKGVFFNKKDLPEDEKARDEVILSIVGRDKTQIDGLGGANPLTCKVAIISPSTKESCDVDYLFAQVVLGENRVDTSPNCGNILSGVGIFAIESGMVTAQEGETKVRVNMLNTDTICELVMQTPNAKLTFKGDARIDGVMGTSSPIICNYEDTMGSSCGALFPTGNESDEINGVPVTCIDNGMPVVLIRAGDIGISGYESCEELTNNAEFRKRLEDIRLKAGEMMNLGDVSKKVVPKMTLISKPVNGGSINTRTFIPHACHSAIGVLGAVSVASACLFEGSVASGIYTEIDKNRVSVEHPSGEFSVNLTYTKNGNEIALQKAGLLRTARLLSKGVAFTHEDLELN